MKSLRLFLALSITLMVIGMLPGAASAQKFSAYTTGINIQNLGSAQATISIEFVNSGDTSGGGGSSANTVSDFIDGYSVKNYFPLTDVAAGFKGSIVVSSSQPVAAVTNLSNSNLTALGAYNGVSQGSTSVYLPVLQKGNGAWDSWYSVQNAGDQTATVDIDYSSTTATVDRTIQIAPKASVTISQATETMHGTVKTFAATLTSRNNMPLVVVAVQENGLNIMAYTGFSSGSLLPVMPTINANNSGYITGTQIYNLGDTATDVTVHYSPGMFGTACDEKQTIPAKGMQVYTLYSFGTAVANEDCKVERFVGSAAVTVNSGSQPLAVVVNQLRTPNYTNGSSYSGFDPAKAGSTVFMPNIMDRNSQWYTAFNVYNAGNTTTYVKCTFANITVTQNTGTNGLAAGAGMTLSQGNNLKDKYVGSGICKTYTDNTYSTEDANGKILTVVNQLGPNGPDNLLSYEGIVP